jgi:hypothetical protein
MADGIIKLDFLTFEKTFLYPPIISALHTIDTPSQIYNKIPKNNNYYKRLFIRLKKNIIT